MGLWQARMLASLGRPDEAGPCSPPKTRLHPQDLETWLALARHQAGRPTRDDKALARTVESARQSAKGRTPELIEARCWQAAGDRAAAEKAFRTARRRRPGDRDVQFEAATFYRDTDQPVPAESCLRDAAAAAPGDRPGGPRAGPARHGTDPGPRGMEPRLEQAGLARQPGPDEPEDRLARAVLLSRCPDTARREEAVPKAKALLADIPASSPAAVGARNFLTRYLVATGRGERALALASASAASGDPAAVSVYAEALIQAKQFEAAAGQIDRLAVTRQGGRASAPGLARDSAAPDRVAQALEALYARRRDTPAGEVTGREVLALPGRRRRRATGGRLPGRPRNGREVPGAAVVRAAVRGQPWRVRRGPVAVRQVERSSARRRTDARSAWSCSNWAPRTRAARGPPPRPTAGGSTRPWTP